MSSSSYQGELPAGGRSCMQPHAPPPGCSRGQAPGPCPPPDTAPLPADHMFRYTDAAAPEGLGCTALFEFFHRWRVIQALFGGSGYPQTTGRGRKPQAPESPAPRNGRTSHWRGEEERSQATGSRWRGPAGEMNNRTMPKDRRVMSVDTRGPQQSIQTDCCTAQSGVGRTLLSERSLQPGQD